MAMQLLTEVAAAAVDAGVEAVCHHDEPLPALQPPHVPDGIQVTGQRAQQRRWGA